MHFSEERAHELLFTKPPQTEMLRERIESSWFVSRPYSRVLQKDIFHERRFQLHPLYESYMAEKTREMEAIYLRTRVRRNFAAVITLKIFLSRWKWAFKEAYYAPGGGGYQKALARWPSTEIVA